MKYVLILRHAKSSWKHEGVDDHDRPLKKRGLRDAPRMGRLIEQTDIVPDHIISSTALRARTTAELASGAFDYDGEIELAEPMYLSGFEAYLESLKLLGGSVRTAMVVGHNPDVEDLVFAITGRTETMPTAALALVGVPIDDWQALREGVPGKLLNLWRPKELADG